MVQCTMYYIECNTLYKLTGGVTFMADYPDWVLKHKKKGTYVNCVKGKYYLYAAHSERIPGTDKVRRVSDGYIGRITEKDGLIPSRDKVEGDVVVYEYGLCAALLHLCEDITRGFRREFRASADRVIVSGLLLAAYGASDAETYEWSYLSVKFPGIDMEKEPTGKQRTAIERCFRMASDALRKRFGDDTEEAVFRLQRIYKVKANGRFYNGKIGACAKEWLESRKIEWSY